MLQLAFPTGCWLLDYGCRWYAQAGTPKLTITTSYDAAKKTFTLNTHQATPPTNGQADKVPVLIPVKVGLSVAAFKGRGSYQGLITA